MKSLKIRRIFTAACMVGVATSLPVLTAPPAQAAARQCQNYLASQNYVVGPRVKAACRQGESITTVAFCSPNLKAIGVIGIHADFACQKAYN